MKNLTLGILAVAAATAILASAPTAQAWIIVDSVTGTATTSATAGGNATGFVTPVVFNQFNSGGILTDVKITLTFDNGIGTTPTVTVSNLTAGALDHDVIYGILGTLQTITGAPVATADGRTTTLTSLDIGQSTSYDLLSGPFSGSVSDFGNAPSYIGAGTFALNLKFATNASDISAGFAQPRFQVVPESFPINYTATVEYDFVPEPASLSLLGLGAMGLLAKRRRRSA